MRHLSGPLLVSALVIAAGCEGAARLDRQSPGAAERPSGVRQIPLRPGIPDLQAEGISNPFAGQAEARHAGERLYHWMNCSGCHFDGGGGIGPPLMDGDWIYGGRPDQIFDSIANGRANGMPAYGDKLASNEIWQIVAHVQSLGDQQGP